MSSVDMQHRALPRVEARAGRGRPMDWYLPGGDPAGVPALRRQIMTYLRQHAAPGSDLADAELVVAELLSNAIAHTDGPARVSLDWDADHPRLRVADRGHGFDACAGLPADPLATGGRGLYLVTRLARDVAVWRPRQGGCVVAATLNLRHR